MALLLLKKGLRKKKKACARQVRKSKMLSLGRADKHLPRTWQMHVLRVHKTSICNVRGKCLSARLPRTWQMLVWASGHGAARGVNGGDHWGLSCLFALGGWHLCRAPPEAPKLTER